MALAETGMQVDSELVEAECRPGLMSHREKTAEIEHLVDRPADTGEVPYSPGAMSCHYKTTSRV